MKYTDVTMSNFKNMTAEEVRLEVNKLQKQMDDLIKNYCLSVSPYKIGDKVLNEDGKLVIINEIKTNSGFFYKGEQKLYQSSIYYRKDLDTCPFYYRVQELRKKDGKPMVHGIRKMFMHLDGITSELKAR
jgi:hypothetical protein